MEPALAGLPCPVLQSTSDEAPGLLAYVEQHLGAHHSPDLFHVQQELSTAVSAPLAVKQRAAAKAVAPAAARLKQGHEYLAQVHRTPAKRGPGRPPKAIACLEQVAQDLETARQEYQLLLGSASWSPRASGPSATPTTLWIWSAACGATASSLPAISSSTSRRFVRLPIRKVSA